jgi:sugar phosphate isomerase/epimerase
MKIGCSTVVFRRYRLEVALERIHRAGYRYVEVEGNAPYCDHVRTREDDPVTFRDRVLGFGFISITCLGSHRELISEETAEEDIRHSLEFAAGAGVPVVATGEGHLPDGMSIEEALDILRPKFERLVSVAERCKVYLAIEPHGSLSLSPGGLEKIISLAPSPWLTINYDTANPRRAAYVGISRDAFEWKSDKAGGGDEVAMLDPVVDKVSHVHIKDVVGRNAVVLGRGEVRLQELVMMLNQAGYKGALSYETEGAQDANESQRMAEESLVYTRGLLERLSIEFD